MAWDSGPDFEMAGVLIDNGSPKAYHFCPDYGSEEELWIPRSQADWIPDPDSEEKRGTMLVRNWLARKNGWNNV